MTGRESDLWVDKGAKFWSNYIEILAVLDRACVTREEMWWFVWDLVVVQGRVGKDVANTEWVIDNLSVGGMRELVEILDSDQRKVFWAGGSRVGRARVFDAFNNLNKLPDGVRKAEVRERFRELAGAILVPRDGGWTAVELRNRYVWGCGVAMEEELWAGAGGMIGVVEVLLGNRSVYMTEARMAMLQTRRGVRAGWGYWRLLPDTWLGRVETQENEHRAVGKLIASDGGWRARLKWLAHLWWSWGGRDEQQVNRALWQNVSGVDELPTGEAGDGQTYRSLVWLRKTRLGEVREMRNVTTHGIELDERLLSSLERSESVYDVVNSLGISTLTGYEIEFPGREWKERVPHQALELDAMQGSGIKHGAGGFKHLEISPGPYRDPRTGREVFRIYKRLGIIDMYQSSGFSWHHNVTLPAAWGVDRLVTGIYLSGAGYLPGGRFSEGRLRIYPAGSLGKDYVEMKTFDVVTPHEWEWGEMSLTYLTWALKAYQLGGYGDISVRRELSQAYVEYDRMLMGLLEAIGIDKTAYFSDKWIDLGKIVDHVVEGVYPTVSSRYDRERIWVNALPVTVGGREWPNPVVCARTIIDEAVRKVNEVVGTVRGEAKTEIEDIIKGGTRDGEVAEFLARYHVPHGGSMRANRQAWERVRWAMAGVGVW